MAFDLPLSRQLAKAGWKVKIRDKERLEDPHVTIIKGTICWRLNLRTRKFMDAGSKWKDIPEQLQSTIDAEANWNRLCQAWDAMYPNNQVEGEEEDDDGNAD